MKIDLAFERIDHLLRNSVGDLRFIGRAEKRNAYLAALELDAALERDISFDGAKAGCSFLRFDRSSECVWWRAHRPDRLRHAPSASAARHPT